MERPAVIAVDDDPGVGRAVERDLRRRYAERYRILRADSGSGALELLDRVVARGDEVALMLVDQRMPQMTGVELLARALGVVPDAKRVLLTAYADTDVAIRAINEVRLDHYLMKPWDPPEEHLYPVLDDLLDDWQATTLRPFQGIRVIGHRWSPAAHAIRDFLTRNQVPYRWLDVDGPEARQALESADLDADRLPIVLLEDGSALVEPSTAEIAEWVGMRTRAELPFYDLVIVGGGPAGLAGAVYGASEGLRTVLIEREAAGGQAGQSSRIENYLGFPAGLSGGDLARRAVAQARRLGAELVTTQEAVGLDVQGAMRVVRLANGSELACHTLLVATGVSYRLLDAPGVQALTGAGVYYGSAASEASSVVDRDVVVVGGANSAGQAAVFFSRWARSVTILCRGGSLEQGMSRYLIEQIAGIDTIVVRTASEVAEAIGDGQLAAVAVRGPGGIETVPASAMFVFIGARPATGWLGLQIATSERGFVLSGLSALEAGATPPWPLARAPYLLETSVPGVFVAGDVREHSVKRVASAVGEGSMAVRFVQQYLSEP